MFGSIKKNGLFLDVFTSQYITKRSNSMFLKDIENNIDKLREIVKGKSILVIGGAGSIGSRFIKAVLPFSPIEICIVDINENAITELTRDLRSSKICIPDRYLTYPMDYNGTVFRKMFENHKAQSGKIGFDIVANFSAHKHVRTEKDIYSIETLLRNNLINAKKLLDLLEIFPPSLFFCVSTDKAANPVNIMGASKRIMEDLIFSYSDAFPVTTARFANVAFSNGSLPFGFLSRIEKLQPISAPLDIKRYFVSLEESGQICMLAAILGNNREIFFPKFDAAEMKTFDNIARNLLKVKGFDILECETDEKAIELAEKLKNGGTLYPVHFSKSDTSGEKLFEEFYTEDEKVDKNRFSSLGVIIGKDIPDRARIACFVNELDCLFERDNVDKKKIVNAIKDYLKNFNHIETGKNLDEKM